MKYTLAVAALAGVVGGVDRDSRATTYTWLANNSHTDTWGSSGDPSDGAWITTPPVGGASSAFLIFNDNNNSNTTTHLSNTFEVNTMELTSNSAGAGTTVNISSTSNGNGLLELGGTTPEIELAANNGVTFNVNVNMSLFSATNPTTTFAGSGTGTFNFNGVISGAGNLVFDNNNTVFIAGLNTYTGTTTVTSGALVNTQNNNALGKGSDVTIASGGQVFDQGGDNFTSAVNWSIAGTGSAADGVGNGALRLSGTGAGTNIFGGVILTANAQIDATGSSTIWGVISGAHNLVFNDATDSGTIRLESNETYSGTTTIGNGILIVAAGVTTGSISASSSIVDNGELEFDLETSPDTYAHAISGSGSILKVGTGIITLSGTNSYTGGLSVGNGTLNLTGTQTAANGALTVQATSGSPTLNIVSGSDTYSSALVDASSGTTIMNVAAGTVTVVGATTVSNGGQLNFNGGIWNQTGNLSVKSTLAGNSNNQELFIGGNFNYSGGSISIANATNSTADSIVSITGTLTTGVGFTFANSSDSNGIVALSAGTLVFTTSVAALTAGGLGSGAGVNSFSLTGANTLDLKTFSVSNGTVPLSGTGSLIIASTGGGGTLDLNTNNSYTGTTTINTGATLQLGNGGAVGSITQSGGITNSGALVFDVASTGFTYSNPISGSGSLTFNGGADVTLSAANSYTGNTTLNAGRVIAAVHNNVFGTQGTVTVASGAEVYDEGPVLANTFSIAGVGGGGADTNPRGAIRLDGGATINGSVVLTALAAIDSGTGSGTVNGIVSGGFGLIVNNADTGTVVFTANETLTGSTTISAGTLQLGNGGTTGSITNSSSITVNGTLFFDSSTVFTYSNPISGSGTLTFGGNDPIIIGDDTFTGAENILAGCTLQLGNGAASGSFLDAGSINNSGTLIFDSNPTSYLYNTNIAGSGAVIQSGADTITLAANNTLTGIVTVNGGSTLQIGDGSLGGSISASGSIIDSGTLIFDSSTSGIVYSNSISGAGAVTQTGSGYTVLEADNSYTGTTTVGGGGLQIGLGTAGGITASATIVDNSALNFQTTDTGAAATYSNAISGTGTLSVFANQITLSGNNTYTGTTSISAGATLQLGNGGTSGNITASNSIQNAGALVFDNTSSTGQTYSNVINGGGSVAVNAGTVTFSAAAETITGAVTVSSGATLALANTNATNGGLYEAASLTINGTVQVNNDNGLFGFGASNTPTLTINSGGVLTNLATADGGTGASVRIYSLLNLNGGTLATNGSLSATNSVDAGTGQSEYGAWELYGGVNVTANSTISAQQVVATQTGGLQINIANGDTLNVSGSFITPLGLSDTGIIVNQAGNSGTLMFTGNSSYTTLTTIDGGTVQVGNGGSTGAITASSGIFDKGALVFDTTNGNLYSNLIGGSGTVTQSGTDTITLGTNETYTGTTTITSGSLQVGNGGAGSITASSSIVDNSTLSFNNSDTGANATYAALISGTGQLIQRGSNAITLTNNETYTGTTTVNSGATLQIGNGGATGSISGSGAIVDNGTLYFDTSTLFTYSNPISGSGTIAYGGGDPIITNDNNSYTGALSIASGSILQLGNGAAAGSYTAASSITNSGSLVFDVSSNKTYGMAISGSGSVTQSGTGTTTLSTTETYTGATAVNNGTLKLTGNLGDTAITVQSGATLFANAGVGIGNTTGATLDLKSGSILNLQDGAVGNLNINSGITSFNSTALTLEGATIDLDIGNNNVGSIDQIDVANGNAVITGTNLVSLSTAGDSSLAAGTYVFLNVENGTKSASPTFEFASNNSTTTTITVGSHHYDLSLVDPSGAEEIVVTPGSAIISIITLNAAGAGTPSGFTSGQQILNHTAPTTAYQGVFSTNTNALTVTGGHNSYTVASATNINSTGAGNTNNNQGNTTAYIEINGFTPGTDEEVVALGIDDNGTLLTATPDDADISTTSIVSDINSLWDGAGYSGTIAYVLSSNPQYSAQFSSSTYNIYLDFTSGQLATLGLSSGDNYLGFDFSQDGSFNAASADITVTAVAVVPEPSSLGLMGLGVAGLAATRRRRKTRKA